MGLQAKMDEVIAALKNKKFLALIFVWGWVLGPALGLLSSSHCWWKELKET
jgi:hypothetical protein